MGVRRGRFTGLLFATRKRIGPGAVLKFPGRSCVSEKVTLQRNESAPHNCHYQGDGRLQSQIREGKLTWTQTPPSQPYQGPSLCQSKSLLELPSHKPIHEKQYPPLRPLPTPNPGKASQRPPAPQDQESISQPSRVRLKKKREEKTEGKLIPILMPPPSI